MLALEPTALSGVFILTPKRFQDSRGWFSEVWNARACAAVGLSLPPFVQDNHSLSYAAGTVRGLHYQAPPHAQGKLVRCIRGRIRDVVVDARRGSPSFGHWITVELSADDGRQIWIPPGFLHGFVTLEPMTEVLYKVTDYYAAECDGSVRFDSLPIDWGIEPTNAIVSDKDAKAPAFSDWNSPFLWESA